MTKMKTSIELAKECGLEKSSKWKAFYMVTEEELEAFRLAVEADYVSRCELKAYISECENFIEYRKEALKELSFEDSHIFALYTLPKETK